MKYLKNAVGLNFALLVVQKLLSAKKIGFLERPFGIEMN